MDCDQIIVMSNGKINAIGTHEELLKKSNSAVPCGRFPL